MEILIGFGGNPYYTVNSEANLYPGVEFLWKWYERHRAKITQSLNTSIPLYELIKGGAKTVHPKE